MSMAKKKVKKTTKEKMTPDLDVLIPKEKMAPKPRVKKTQDPWDKVKARKTHSLMTNLGLGRFFRDQIQANLVDNKVFFNSAKPDLLTPADVFDILKENHCENEETVRAWVLWYVKQHITGKTFVKSDLLKMKSMVDTWKTFAPLRPATVYPGDAAIESKKSIVPSDCPSIRRECEQMIGEAKLPLVEQSLYRFGVVVVANFLKSKMESMAVKEVIETILSRIKSQSLNGRHDLQLIFRASTRYSTKRTDVFLSDWKACYQAYWDWAVCQEAKVDAFYTKQAEDFFNEV